MQVGRYPPEAWRSYLAIICSYFINSHINTITLCTISKKNHFDTFLGLVIENTPITVSGVDIVPLKSARFLGIQLDQNVFSLSTQLGNTIKFSLF